MKEEERKRVRVRERLGARERRNITVGNTDGPPPICAPVRARTTAYVCALAGNWTRNPSVYETALQLTEPPSQDHSDLFLKFISHDVTPQSYISLDRNSNSLAKNKRSYPCSGTCLPLEHPLLFKLPPLASVTYLRPQISPQVTKLR